MIMIEPRIVTVREAFKIIDGMRDDFFSRIKNEYISVDALLNRRLSSDVISTRMCPAYDTSAMDGYAVRSDDTGPRALTGEIYAGDTADKTLNPGEAIYITTGAPMPSGADAVVKVEDAVVKDGMVLATAAPRWDNVVRAGTDFNVGDIVLRKGTLVSPPAIGLMHAAGVPKAAVYSRIRAAVISTGEEIKNGATKNSNAPMVMAMLESWGCEHEDMGVVGDSAAEVSEALKKAVSCHDIVITIGGVSMGKKDPVAAALPDIGDIAFKGIRIKPGKPMTVSTVGGTPVFSLPGKPAGAYTSMELIVRRFIMGDTRIAAIEVPLDKDLDFIAKGYDHVVYICLKGGKALPVGFEGTPLSLFSGPSYGTSILSSSTRSILADGFFIANDGIKAGQMVSVNIL